MSDFTQNVLTHLGETLTAYKTLQAEAREQWLNFKMPTRKTEEWKYSRLTALQECDFGPTPTVDLNAETLVEISAIEQLGGQSIVFVNGRISAELSSIKLSEPSKIEGLNTVLFSKATDAQNERIHTLLNSTFDVNAYGFAQLNTASFSEGLYLSVEKNCTITAPLRIISVTTESEQHFVLNLRTLVDVGEGAEFTLIEHFVTQGEQQQHFVNTVTECLVADNAKLNHFRLQEEHERAMHIGAVHTRLGRSARLEGFYLALGSTLKRVDITVNYAGEGAEGNIVGVYLPKNKQHVDFHTCMEHAVPHCTSHEVFRGIVADESRAVFSGRIHIHRDAQKTEAYLSNKNLLTSNRCEVDTKPELEIYADDVRCAHGATVAQLDPLSVHYLKTRGVSEEEAIVMLSFGFINELISDIKLEALVQYLRPKLATQFARDPALLRHIV